MPIPPKKLGWLAEHLPAIAPDATATSADQIRRLMQPSGNSIGPWQRGNIPLPMPAPKETREGSIMSRIADFLPILGEMRGVQAGFQTAKEGHPVFGGVLAAASVIPGVSKELRAAAPFFSRVERAIADAPFKKGTAEQWAAHIAKNSAAGEREWTGVAPFLSQNSGKVLTQDQVKSAFTPIKLGEKVLGGAASRPRVNGNVHDGYVVHVPDLGEGYEPIHFADARDANAFVNHISESDSEGLLSMSEDYEGKAQRFQRAGNHEDAQRHFRMAEALQSRAEIMDLGRGGSDGAPKFAQYTEPGGKNYREKLVTLDRPRQWVNGSPVTEEDLATPNGRDAADRVASFKDEPFRSSHFETPNILTHLRMKDRQVLTYTPAKIADIEQRLTAAMNGINPAHLGSGAPEAAVRKGAITPLEAAQYSHAKGFSNDTQGATEKVLHLEELQSDWHQQGRAKGYAQPPLTSAEKARKAYLMDGLKFGQMGDETFTDAHMHELDDLLNRHARYEDAKRHGVPNAPFKKTEDWQLLGLKHAIHDAVHGGYDRVAWTPGDLQNARYDLSQQVGRIDFDPKTGDLNVFDPQKTQIHNSFYDAKALPDVIGKEASERLLATEPQDYDGTGAVHRLEGEGLQMGGSGMRGFYDKMLPNNLKDYFKKLGLAAPTIEPMAFGKRSKGEIDAAMDALQAQDGWINHPPTRAQFRALQDERNGAPDRIVPFPSFKITPELRNLVQTKGQPLWATVPFIGAGALAFGNDDPQKP